MSKSKGLVLYPILIWIVGWFLMLSYGCPLIASVSTDIIIYGIIFFIVERLIILFVIHEMCKTYKLNANIWSLVTLIFGLNVFLFINIKIWMQAAKQK